MATGGSQPYPLTARGAGTGRLGLQLVPPVRPWSQAAVCSAAYLASERVSLGKWQSPRSPISAWVASRCLPYSRLLWPRLEVSAAVEALWPKLRLLPQPLKSLIHLHRLRPFGPRPVLPDQLFHHRSLHRSQSPHRFPNHHQSRAHVARQRTRGAITSVAGNISTALRRPFAITSSASPVSGPAPTVMSTSALTEHTATRVAGKAPARIMAVSADLCTGPRP
jgi:hypothetical protein